jgi:hypothetical protein
MLNQQSIHEEIEQLVEARVREGVAAALRGLADQYETGKERPKRPATKPAPTKRKGKGGKRAARKVVTAKAAKPRHKGKHVRGFVVKVVKAALTDTPSPAEQVFDRVHRKYPDVERDIVTKTLAQLFARGLLSRHGTAKPFKYAKLASG